MSKDAGDKAYRHGHIVEMEWDGNGSEGDLVTVSSGQVTPTSANGESIVGVISEDVSDNSSGDEVSVGIHGTFYVNADGSITEGDLLQPSGSTNGHAVSADSAEGLVTAVDEGGTDTYDVYSKYAMALNDASDGELVGVLLG